MFWLIECVCQHSYVRSELRGTNWDCPACGEKEDYDNLMEVPGPARSLSDAEGLHYMKGGS